MEGRGHASHMLDNLMRLNTPSSDGIRKEDDITREGCMLHTYQSFKFGQDFIVDDSLHDLKQAKGRSIGFTMNLYFKFR